MSRNFDLIPTNAQAFADRVAIDREYVVNGQDIRVLITQVCPHDLEEVVDYIAEDNSADVVVTYYQNSGTVKSYIPELINELELAQFIAKKYGFETASNSFITMPISKFVDLEGDERSIRQKQRALILNALNEF